VIKKKKKDEYAPVLYGQSNLPKESSTLVNGGDLRGLPCHSCSTEVLCSVSLLIGKKKFNNLDIMQPVLQRQWVFCSPAFSVFALHEHSGMCSPYSQM
jgi:hypothetical protein